MNDNNSNQLSHSLSVYRQLKNAKRDCRPSLTFQPIVENSLMSCTASSIHSSVSEFGTDASIISVSSLSDTEQKCYNENDNIWIVTDKSVDIDQQIKVYFCC